METNKLFLSLLSFVLENTYMYGELKYFVHLGIIVSFFYWCHGDVQIIFGLVNTLSVSLELDEIELD